MKTHNLFTHLFSLHRWQKRLLMLAADSLLLPFAVWAAFAMRLGTWTPDMKDGVWLLMLAPLISIPIFIKLGLYRAVVRYIGGQAIQITFVGVLLSTVLLLGVAALLEADGIPRSVYVIYAGTAFIIIGGSRYFIRRYYRFVQDRQQGKIPVAIYGAGESGRQLASMLTRSPEYAPVLYVDDDSNLHQANISGMKVYSPLILPILIEKYHIKQVLLAMPSASNTRRREIINQLEYLPVHVRTIPSLTELVSGKSDIDSLREIDIEELLGRVPVTPDDRLLSANIRHKNIMITGAGGSIGSELCRQIIRLSPSCLVLFESSELALYQIERELQEFMAHEKLTIPLIPTLGSVQDRLRVEETLRANHIQTLYHAAAYKHVPMVECNPIEGIRNNTFGTFYTAQAALNVGVERFVLISTDKAVRPTNVMGASKRLCELVLQGFSQVSSKTVFCMVRFGNVLGSSGSVVPLFRRQIQEGGPITVTHPDIIRFFMTIPEAAQLVIQAGAMAKGGEVFLLDMGEPVKILDLAKRMIHLSGLQVQDETNPQGNIRIEVTGLRPGEKLYEELLIDSDAEKTAHPRIFKANESCLPWLELEATLDELRYACEQRNLPTIYQILSQKVQGYVNKIATTSSVVVKLPVKKMSLCKDM
ncbi:NDP-sugar epimerase, includes UDP-GlcNAc-inverting 4,6-dehydratase FlaA1 and capsular polysaccharide biosynthesis protein EpsC [Thiothrix caldifontis]|uniref:NDP-sugar epimerase, includes UDP-GlcNAc-inverting 4,6-dehydratase FlaA1 and capsular polysaccharide biosynthesis protein EpsC n=1 Tax=Thiothrix caldifontis TaxID=525918 RepID=A0A1H4DNM2_9GAMM|nr:nucleoside-diphosphate sugar epimerase/dehydratase [Thiothrix caldifontis]SEA74040.1 NDP-sugar epimerase, includes UDP-GlcNAc-inverting 4,6-dehydratase FlaA1 and capsular polysaccharide biosynthesis protein EpsC [Thiothrix caldifontis]